MCYQESAIERWRPILGVEQIIVSVISMLSDPNDDSPANIDAAVSIFNTEYYMYVTNSGSVCVGDVEKRPCSFQEESTRICEKISRMLIQVTLYSLFLAFSCVE